MTTCHKLPKITWTYVRAYKHLKDWMDVSQTFCQIGDESFERIGMEHFEKVLVNTNKNVKHNDLDVLYGGSKMQ